MDHALLEIACFNLSSARMAQAAGADRIELCEDYAAGGVTPDAATIIAAVKEIHIPFFVMIRSRSGNFVYNACELEIMRDSVLQCKALGVKGIVFGALTGEGDIDTRACATILAAAGDMQMTFHRAIDDCVDPDAALQTLVDLGIKRVLTSGRAATALLGSSQLQRWHTVYEKQLVIMPGGGIRSGNIAKIRAQTGCMEFHSAALLNGHEMCDVEEIKKMIQHLA